jgi:type VI protein secretion system component VasK
VVINLICPKKWVFFFTALFRLLDQSNLQTSTDTKNFQLTFDLNGNAVRYQLFAANPINPFIPGILEGFRCPEQLGVKRVL